MISIPPTAARRSARGIIAMVVTAAMTVATIGTVPPAAAQPPPFDWAALVPTADSLRQVQADLPDDEISATEHLVDTVWGADSLAAVSATGEILRRAGLPLVSADGPVVALPDGNVILNAPVLVEFLPTLTNAARSGTMYRPDQVAELLQFVGFAAEVPPGRDVVGLLAAWGKAHDDIPEVRAAGTAIRAIARIRGQLLIPATVPTPAQLQLVTEDPGAIPGNVIDVITGPTAVAGIDPISTVLLLAHAGGELAAGLAVEPAGSRLRSPAVGAFRSDGGTVDCDALIDESDSRAGKEYEGAGKEFAKGQTRGALSDAAEHYGGETASKWTNLGGEAYDKLTDVISVVLLLLGAELTLEPDRKQTHFRHAPGERHGDVTVKATAKFSSALAKRHLRCWSLIGIDVPPDGPLKGYTVKWSMSKTPEAFQALSDSSDKFLHGDVTDGSGVSSVSVYPRTELEPPKSGESQPELTIAAKIYASLDKDDFPWKLSDLLSMATAGGLGAAAVQALYNLLMSLVKRGALPTKVSTIQVKYHGQMPFVMQGEMNATAAFVQVSVDFRADLYSCTGPLGT